jgi:PAS domain S-box-containing protein
MSKDGNRAEEALTSSEQELRLVVEAIPALVWRAAPEGNIDYVNKRLLEYLGAPLDEVTGWGWMDKVHPDDVAFKVRTWLQNLESTKPHRIACRFRGADSRYRWFEVRGEPLRAGDGRVLRWYGVLIDIDDQRKAEEALRESESKNAEEQPRSAAQLQATLNVIPAYTWYAAPSGGLTFVNKRTGDFLGLPKDDPLRTGIDIGAQWDAHISLLHPDDHEETRKVWSTCLRTGEAGEVNFRVRNAQGGYRWFLSRTEPLRASDGTILQWVGVNLEIEELKCAEQALQRSQFYLREGQRLAHMGSWALNPSGFFDHWSHQLFQIYGLDPQKGPPTLEQYLATVHPLDRDFMAETIRRMHAQRCGCDVKKRIVRPNGELRYIHCVCMPVIEDEVLKGFLGSAMDITEQELLTQELERRQAYLAEAQALSQTGSVAFNEKTILYWSDETYRILGFDPGKGLPSREAVAQRIHPDDREQVYEEARRAVLQKRDYKLEYRFTLPAGTIKFIEVTAHPKFSASGELVEVVSTLIDVTERKRAQEEHERLRELESDLAHMNRVSMMGELAASLAHEITQPIAAARNNARAALNFLDKQARDLGDVREALGCVVGNADRAGLIVDRIRDHTKKAPPRKHRFDLNEAINEVIVLARSAIAANGVFVQTRLTDGQAPVEGDRVQLQQVLLNLVLNAAEAMSAVDERARELLVTTEQSRTNGVLVAVRDSGPGIDPENIERVFDAFYTTKSSGLGMGLAICRSIIDAHGGRLWADANEPRGAAFQFTLPSPERSS